MSSLIKLVRSAVQYWDASWTEDQIKIEKEQLRSVGSCDPEYQIWMDLKEWLLECDTEYQKSILKG